MHDILIALVFVGMVAYPAMVNILPSKEESTEETNGFQSLSLALAHAKHAVPSGKTSSAIR